MNIIILGPQGSGKGTQAELIAKKLGLFHMETGKMFREISKNNKRIKDMIDNGILVPGEETINYMDKYLTKNHIDFSKITFDGFPRTDDQYLSLREWLKKRNFSIDKVILLEVSEDESVRRLSARRTCEQCGKLYNLITNPPPNSGFCECGGKLVQRDDDKTETIKKRLITYKSETEPLVKLFEEEGILLRVNGERPVNEIFEEIIAKIKGDDGNVTNTN